MPTVPALHEFSVAPSGAPLPGVQSPEVQDYGSQQIERAGQAISRGGARLGDVYERQLHEVNLTRVHDAVNQAKELRTRLTFDQQTGYSSKRGLAAIEPEDGVNLADKYAGEFEKGVGEIAAGLGNDAQRLMFSEAAGTLSTDFRNEIIKHQASEFVTYKKSVIEGAVATLQNDLYAYRNDSRRVDETLLGLKGQFREAARMNGMSEGEALDAAVRQATSRVLLLSLKTMVDEGDIDGAEAFYNLHEQDMDAPERADFAHVIGQEQDLKVATNVASEYFANLTGSQAAAAPQNLIAPVTGAYRQGSGFGVPRAAQPGVPAHSHKGIDIPIASGTRVIATGDGVVEFVGKSGAYGNLVKIKHDDGSTETRYAHLKGFAPDLKVGQRVRQGDVIAISGGERGAPGAGDSTGPHLHYEVRKDGVAVDPKGAHTVRSGRRMNVTEALQALRSDPRVATNPRRLQEAERQIRSLSSEWEQTKNQNEENAVNAAMEWLDKNGGRYEQMPASLRNAVPGKYRDSLRSFSTSMQRSADPAGSTELWGTLRMEIGQGNITTPQQLLKYKPNLSEDDYRNLVATVSGAQKEPTTLDPVKTASAAMSNLKADLTTAGIDPGDADTASEFKQFQAAFFREVSRQEAAQGKPLTETEATTIGRTLIAKNVVRGEGMFGRSTTRRGYEFENPLVPYAAISQGVRSKIAIDLRKEGIAVTEDNIRKRYARFIRETGQ